MSLIKPVIREFSTIKTAFNAGQQLAQKNNQGIIKGVGKGVTNVYRYTGVLPIITGTVTGVGLIGVPGSTTAGVVAGIFLKKGLKNFLKLLKKTN